MSTFTEQVRELTRELDRRDLEEMSKDAEPGPRLPLPSGAAAALAANAGEIDYTISPTPSYLSDSDIEVQGCKLIDAVNYFMQCLAEVARQEGEEEGVVPVPLTAGARHVVLVVCGLSGGDYENFREVDQKFIAERLGVDARTVRNYLKELYDWEYRYDTALLQVEEQERTGGSVKFGTTRYRAVAVYHAAEFLRRLKARGLRPVNLQRRLNPATAEIVRDVVSEQRGQMPNSDIRKQRESKARDVTPKQARIRFLEDREAKFYRAAAELRDALKQSGYDPVERGDEYFAKFVEIFRG